MIKVLIVDDARTARAALRMILERDPEIIVVGEASDGSEAMQLIQKYDPHLVTMDIYLEQENGLDLTRQIMTQSPRPILIITGISPHDPELGYRAIERGALEVLPKPVGPDHPDYSTQAAKLVRIAKTLSKVPILHQRRRSTATVHPPLFDTRSELSMTPVSQPPEQTDLLLIGASTGGPPVISGILERLPRPCPIPVVVVQHITKGFAAGFCEWLGHASGHPAVLVAKREMLSPGTVFVASDDADIVFSSPTTLNIRKDAESRGARPNIDRLFISAAQYNRRGTIAIVLTGMGADGAMGLAALKASGATVAVQAPESCAVDSMPKSALQQGVTKALRPDDIVRYIQQRLARISRIAPENAHRLNRG